MNCDMCGKDGELYQAKIEGTVMNVCRNCAKFGKVIRKRVVEKIEIRKKEAPKEEGPVEMVVANYNELIKNAREKLGLKQEELAQQLNLKTSMINNIERKKFKPNPDLARKLEKNLRIKLVEEYEEEKSFSGSGQSSGMTFGDLIKKRK